MNHILKEVILYPDPHDYIFIMVIRKANHYIHNQVSLHTLFSIKIDLESNIKRHCSKHTLYSNKLVKSTLKSLKS